MNDNDYARGQAAIGGGTLGNYAKTATTQAEPSIGKALDAQDTLIQQMWQVIGLLRERLQVVSQMEPPTAGKDAINRPQPERFLDRIQQNNRTLSEQGEAIGSLMNRLAL